jgi:metal-responsive CopG/Arc/MetJ family transcriptional regulator
MDVGRMTKMIGFSVPPTVAEEVEQVAQQEGRTKSELFREMFRLYKRYRKQRAQEEERWVADLIQEVKEEDARRPMSVEELLREEAELAQYGREQTKKLGLEHTNINRIIHESRKRRRA